MSTAKAEKFLLEKLGASTTVLLSLHLALETVPDWCDGTDADGRAVLLVGAHQLRQLPEGAAAVAAILGELAAGHVPPGVHAIAYAPRASEALSEMVAGEGVDEILIDGPRGTGKTQMVPGALAALA